MSLQQSVDLTTNTTFRQRVLAAAVTAAVEINGEATTEGHDEYYRKRSSLAQRVLQSPSSVVESFTWVAAVNPTISVEGTSAPDGDIQYVVNTCWDDLAGVATGEAPA